MTSNSRCEVQTMDEVSCLALQNQYGPECETAAENDDNGSTAHLAENTRDAIETHIDSAYTPHDDAVHEDAQPESMAGLSCSTLDSSITNVPLIPGKTSNVPNGVQSVDVHERNRSAKSRRNAAKNEQNLLFKCRTPGACKESFKNRDALMFHMATYHAKGIERSFCCYLCKDAFKLKSNLRRHMKSIHNGHGQLRFVCPIQTCSREFTEKASLKRHLNAVHTQKSAFKCSKCPMMFSYKNNLIRHLANIHGERTTFRCYLCKEPSHTKKALQMHMIQIHSGRSSFKCHFPMCSKSFTHKGNLNVHTNAVHTKENVYKCTECSNEFYSKGYLNKHFAANHGGITFNCDLCKKSLASQHSLKRHINSMHMTSAQTQ